MATLHLERQLSRLTGHVVSSTTASRLLKSNHRSIRIYVHALIIQIKFILLCEVTVKKHAIVKNNINASPASESQSFHRNFHTFKFPQLIIS